jgi:hypothetical protein
MKSEDEKQKIELEEQTEAMYIYPSISEENPTAPGKCRKSRACTAMCYPTMAMDVVRIRHHTHLTPWTRIAAIRTRGRLVHDRGVELSENAVLLWSHCDALVAPSTAKPRVVSAPRHAKSCYPHSIAVSIQLQSVIG